MIYVIKVYRKNVRKKMCEQNIKMRKKNYEERKKRNEYSKSHFRLHEVDGVHNLFIIYKKK